MKVWIHKDLAELDPMDRSKVGIEFYVRNLKSQGHTPQQLEELADYFAREIKGNRPEYNQTS